MNNLSKSFTVSSPTNCNNETILSLNETDKATVVKLVDLIALATRVIERNQCNFSGNQHETTKFPIHETINNNPNRILKLDSFMVSLAKEGNYETTLACLQCDSKLSFCICSSKPKQIVTCNACEHFIPDRAGDETAIGRCELGITWTQELNGHMPLYRYTDRHCDKFSKLMN